MHPGFSFCLALLCFISITHVLFLFAHFFGLGALTILMLLSMLCSCFRLVVPPSEKHNPAVEDPVSTSDDAVPAMKAVVA